MGRRAAVRYTGAVYTPSGIASALVSAIKPILPDQCLKVLEPSVGDGAFLDQIVDALEGAEITAVDIDQNVMTALSERFDFSKASVEFLVGDFIEYATGCISAKGKTFDLVVGNPPFIRGRNFSDDFKRNIREFSEGACYPLGDLKNSWVAFLVASTKVLSENGVVAFVLPYEIITVDYGKKALRFLCSFYDCIDIYVSREKAFPSIDQDAVIFVGQRSCDTRKGLYVKFVESMFDLVASRAHKVSLDESANIGIELSSFLIPKATLDLLKDLRRRCASIHDYAGSAPGIVSAANDFFILRESDVYKLGLEDYVVPILKKGSFASFKPVFSRQDFLAITPSEPCYLLSIKGDFDCLDKRLQEYIKFGEGQGFHLRYKCRNRKNWYEVPIVARELGFVFKRSHILPRVCLNEADVFLTDTAYGLRMKDGFTIHGLCYSFYNSLTVLFAEIDGRFYGGGVLELSPNEFRGLPLVYHEPTQDEFNEFLDIHDQAAGNVSLILDYGDRWLKRALGLSSKQVAMIQQALDMVRKHRMRHGRR
ncbi:N-6 DNA methylase [Pseudomonas aeruginosa]|uniref:Eco57I restriction-modification methylase domain-containing protein n=1 Tax=Pseudomonas aeruginosa TaxID=287 RepID=UPI000447D645|nr:class I SAM-dependent methyltransferase [Pseudomonas aeruginosa]EZO28815.1 hypothetical protein AJ61_05000 [Pseudomonas aeruginosa 3574]MBH9240115.1 N-6 DNA methylase [Pseudomonas aeruginosa]HBO5115383.1 N-6 DNA methylase [Pseudomonas aeruginosa]HCF3016306.1 N-6 DNA methylase [Pseudomonas aeruginosa]HCI1750186.1 N-6 DNA methylase [Pseudomonas aeruginosa]